MDEISAKYLREINPKLIKNVAWNVSLDNLKRNANKINKNVKHMSKYLQSARLLHYTPYVTLKPLPELMVAGAYRFSLEKAFIFKPLYLHIKTIKCLTSVQHADHEVKLNNEKESSTPFLEADCT